MYLRHDALQRIALSDENILNIGESIEQIMDHISRYFTHFYTSLELFFFWWQIIVAYIKHLF